LKSIQKCRRACDWPAPAHDGCAILKWLETIATRLDVFPFLVDAVDLFIHFDLMCPPFSVLAVCRLRQQRRTLVFN